MVVVFFELITKLGSGRRKLFRVLLYELHPSARVATVGIDGDECLSLGVQLVDYILQGNHAVFEHPIPGARISMATIIEVDVLPFTII